VRALPRISRHTLAPRCVQRLKERAQLAAGVAHHDDRPQAELGVM